MAEKKEISQEEVQIDSSGTEGYDSKSLIFKAIEFDDVDLLTSLICRRNISPNFYKDEVAPICKAASLGNIAILAVLIHGNCILNTPDIKDHMWQRHPIHIAASKGHTHFVRVLVENGVSIDQRDRDNRTALHWAAVFGEHGVAKYLLSAGAAVNAVQTDGFTALHVASCFGHQNVCRVLLDWQADMNISDNDGWNVFHTAACYGHLQVVKMMVQLGIDINKETKQEENLLHFACSGGHFAIVKYLVEQGIKLNKKNSEGYTAFHLGVFHNRYDVCRYLAEAGAIIQTKNKAGLSPCHHVAIRMDEKFLTLLIKVGYNFSAESWIHTDSFPASSVKTCDKVYLMMKNLASNCHSLKDSCCLKIRHLLGKDYKSKVQTLVLPTLLKDIISFQELGDF